MSVPTGTEDLNTILTVSIGLFAVSFALIVFLITFRNKQESRGFSREQLRIYRAPLFLTLFTTATSGINLAAVFVHLLGVSLFSSLIPLFYLASALGATISIIITVAIIMRFQRY